MKGQFFLIFALILLIAVLPLFLTSEQRPVTSIQHTVQRHAQQIPAAVNGIALQSNMTQQMYALRQYMELERHFFEQRLADFSAITVIGVGNTSMEAIIANYNMTQDITVSINDVEQTVTVDRGEITTLSFDSAPLYNITVSAGEWTQSVTTHNDVWYLSRWHVVRGNTQYNIVRSG